MTPAEAAEAGHPHGPYGLASRNVAVELAIDERNELAAWLLANGHTSRALADVCGVTHQTVRNWAAKALTTS
jgi:DNA invertase Pin-like site-specific DNA recombinase